MKYEPARREAKRVKTWDEREVWERLGNKLEDIHGKKKLIFTIAKSYGKKDENQVNIIKNKGGPLIEETEVDK